MPIIRCTSKLLAAIDDDPFESETATTWGVGDWYGQIFTVDRRKCLLFIHEPTLFVCLATNVVKADYRYIAPFFTGLLAKTLRQEGFDERAIALILGLHADLTIGRSQSRSAVGSLNNRATDAKHIIQHQGGPDVFDVLSTTHVLNMTPMKPIGYSNGLEQMKALIAEISG